MDNNSKQNSSCGFSDLMVSYLYDEIGEAEKMRFESHASNCRPCADEVSAFGGIRMSLQNWRETEFEPLATPVIESPWTTEPRPVISNDDAATVSRSWFSVWLERYSFSTAWAGAAAACAALAICIGLIYTAFSSMQSQPSVAEVNKTASVAGVPTPTVGGMNTSANSAANESSKSGDSPMPEIKSDKKPTAPKSLPSHEKSAAVDNADVKSVKINVSPRPSNKEKPAQNVKKAAKKSDIDLMTREEEDDSLRLTDLFDEVSMK